jgi:hypothetical protein
LVAVVHARGGEGPDLTGIWTIQLSGASSRTCTATLDHFPGDTPIGASLECSDVGEGGVIGIFDPRTNGVYLRAEFYDAGSVVWAITLEGTLADDGSSFAGEWFEFYEREPSGTFQATRTGPIVSPHPTLPEPVDVSGTWHVNFTGAFTGDCDAMLQQKGRALSGAARCDVLGALLLSGRIDAATGVFTLGGGGGGGGVELAGTASDDDAATGGWRSSGFFTGTFTAARSDDVEFLELNGDWDAIFDGQPAGGCSVSFDQDLLLLDAAVDCGDLGAGDLTGSFGPVLGDFDLEGVLGDVEVAFGGRLAADGGSFLAEFFGRRSEDSYQLIAVPAGQLDRGIIAVDCHPERERLQTECFSRSNDDLAVAIAIIVPPTALPERLDVTFMWHPDLVDYHPAANAADEVIDDRCADVQRTVQGDRVSFSCLLAPGVSSGPLIALTLTCLREASVWPDVPILDLVGSSSADGTALVDGRIAPCAGPEHGGYPLGDADCAGDTTSIDGALVLQYDARLLESLACYRAADANRDEVVNSVDASLILQLEAGLLERLPLL